MLVCQVSVALSMGFPGSKVGTELVSWGVCTCLFLRKVLSCSWWCASDVHFLAMSLPCLVPFVCASEPQIPALKISDISVSTSWGFAWFSAHQQGQLLAGFGSRFCNPVWWSCIWRRTELPSCVSCEFGTWLAGDIRYLGFVINNNCFLTVCTNRKQHTVIIWKRRNSGGHSGQICPEQGPCPDSCCVCIPLISLVSFRPSTRLPCLVCMWCLRC